jgi:hypothetical protein
MLHAVVRCGAHAFHFASEVTGYDAQTLHEHVMELVKHRGAAPVDVNIEIDAQDTAMWYQQFGYWLSPLLRAGVPVRIAKVSLGGQGRRPDRLPSHAEMPPR